MLTAWWLAPKISPGEGKIAAAGYARENDIPCLGLCLGEPRQRLLVLQRRGHALTRELRALACPIVEHAVCGRDLAEQVFEVQVLLHGRRLSTKMPDDQAGAKAGDHAGHLPRSQSHQSACSVLGPGRRPD